MKAGFLLQLIAGIVGFEYISFHPFIASLLCLTTQTPEVFHTILEETTSLFASWNHILLSVEINNGSTSSIVKAVKIEKNI